MKTTMSLLLLLLLSAGACPVYANFCAPPAPPPPAPPPTRPRPECEKCATLCTGSPCYVGSGVYVTEQEDLSVRTVGLPLAMHRKYESSQTADGPLGIGWSSSLTSAIYFNAYLYAAPSTYTYEANLVLPNGFVLKFTQRADGTFDAPNGRADTLVRNADMTWSYTPELSRTLYRYNVDGTIASITDEFGTAVTFTYDGNGRLQRAAESSGSGRFLDVGWTGGRITSVTDNGGRTVRYRYGTDGTLSGYDDAITSSLPAEEAMTYSYTAGRTGLVLRDIRDRWARLITELEWHSDGRLKSYTEGTYTTADLSGEKYTYTYGIDDFGSPWTNKTDSLGFKHFRYSATGQVTNHGTGYTLDGRVQSDGTNVYEYDGYGHVMKMTTAGVVRDFTYDAVFTHQPATIIASVTTGRNWPSYRYEYFQAGSAAPGATKKIERRRTDNVWELAAEFTYNTRGQVLTSYTPDGRLTTFGYEPDGDLSTVQTPAGTTAYTYDSLGRVLTIVGPGGTTSNPTGYTYDAADRIKTVTLPKPTATSALDFTTTYAYDLYDSTRQLSYSTAIDPNGAVTRQYFDALGHLVETSQRESATATDALTTTNYAYRYNLLRTITDANGNVTRYEYDSNRRQRQTVFPDAKVESYTWIDATGALETVTDRKGELTVHVTDTLGRPLSTTYGSKAVTYVYDGPVLKSVTDGLASPPFTYDYTYDTSDRRMSETTPSGHRIDYTYPVNTGQFFNQMSSYSVVPPPPPPGSPAEVTQTVEYSPDSAGRIGTIVWTSTQAAQFGISYHANGGYDTITFPNGQTRKYTYDLQGRITTVTNTLPGANPVEFQYGYDHNWAGASPTRLGQRTSVTEGGIATKYSYDALYQLVRTEQATTPPYREEISYDAIGNRKTFKKYSGTNLYLDATYAYFRDTANPNRDSARLQSSTLSTYTYDPNGNVLTRNQSIAYGWDEANRLVNYAGTAYSYDYTGRRLSAGTRRFVNQGLNVVGIRDTANTSVRDHFLFAPGIDEPLAHRDSTGAIEYYLADALGSIIGTSDTTGNVTARYQYTAWGETTTATPPFGYTAREPDQPGWYYRARYYEASTGRFLSEDPLRFSSGINHYTYVLNAPVMYTDPSGLCLCAFKGSVGRLTVSTNCKGKLAMWVISERGAPASGAVGGRSVSADGFVHGGRTYKIDGSTCVEVDCSGGGTTLTTCINMIACLLGKRGPYEVAPGEFGGSPKEPTLGAPAPLVR